MRTTWLPIMGLTASLLALAGCGGGGTSIAFIPPPTTTPTPTPTPSPAPVPGPAVPAALQTPSPASPVAGSVTFSTLAQPTDFPLLMTAAFGGPGDGDQATTTAGGVLHADGSGGYFLTINNSSAGVSNVAIPSTGPTQGSVFFVTAGIASSDLDYMRYGYWERGDVVDGVFNVGAWTAGFVTSALQIPTQGSATYAGKMTGLYNVAISTTSPADFDSRVTGNVSLTANFAQSSLSGSITNIVATSMYTALTGPVNDIGFSASIDRANNMFSGATSVTSSPGGAYAFGPTAAGLINGRFYGPNAVNVGAVFNVSEGTRRLIGSFGAQH